MSVKDNGYLATIDVGTNTAHLLVVQVDEQGVLPVLEETRYVRLGQGVDRTGRLHPDALQRLLRTLKEFVVLYSRFSPARVIVAGTSASRDLRNRESLVSSVRKATGLEYGIISGDEEAWLTSLGALSVLERADRPAMVLDIGGGSTELTLLRPRDGLYELLESLSLDLGSVRLTERHFGTLPPDGVAVEVAVAEVESFLSRRRLPETSNALCVGAAGTLCALVLLDRGATTWKEMQETSPALSADQVSAWCGRLLSLSREEVLALNPPVLRGREDVIAAGVLILDCLMRRMDIDEITVSSRGLRHGLALRHAGRSTFRSV